MHIGFFFIKNIRLNYRHITKLPWNDLESLHLLSLANDSPLCIKQFLLKSFFHILSRTTYRYCFFKERYTAHLLYNYGEHVVCSLRLWNIWNGKREREKRKIGNIVSNRVIQIAGCSYEPTHVHARWEDEGSEDDVSFRRDTLPRRSGTPRGV